jgi:hypothetical protein
LIVGAGAAGLTCAAALTHFEMSVDIVDRAEEPMHLQLGCGTRYIHPRLFDWPLAEDWSSDDAGLPIMNWSAGTADAVSKSLLRQFSERTGQSPICGVYDLAVQQAAAGGWTAEWRSREVAFAGTYTCVILAVGFGIEKTVEYAPRISYWRQDTLNQSPLYEEGMVLISGIGDGGLIDVLRAMLRGFDLQTIGAEYLSGTNMAQVAKELIRIEEKAHEDAVTEPTAVAVRIAEAYRRVQVPKWFTAKLRDRLRGRRVVLLGRQVAPFLLRASILNRFFVSQLLKLGLQYRVGSLEGVEPREYGYSAWISAGEGLGKGRKEQLDVDQVVVRHGASSSLERWFPEVWNALLSRQRSEFASLTVQPQWNDEAFLVASSGKTQSKIRTNKQRAKRKTQRTISPKAMSLSADILRDDSGNVSSFYS